MKKVLLTCLAACMASACFAIWPFGGNAEAKRMEEVAALLRDPQKVMAEAAELEREGQRDAALEKYTRAVEMLDRLAQKHDPDGRNPEFASLRVMSTTCLNTINVLQMANVSASPERRVSVTSTSELEALLAQERAERARDTAENPDAPATPAATPAEEPAAPAATPATPTPPATPATPAETVTPAPAAPVNPEAATVPPAKAILTDDESWANMLWDDGDFEKLEAFLPQALEKHPGAPELMILLAQLRLCQGRYEDAAALSDTLATHTSAPVVAARASLVAAGAYLGLGQHREAMASLDRVIKQYPKQPAAYINMAWVLSEMGENSLPGAIAYYTHGVGLGGARDLILERRFNMGETE